MRLLLVVLLSVWCVTNVAWAQALRVAPLRVDFSERTQNSALKLTNLTNADLPVQVSVVEWWQEDGKDNYRPSRDVLFSPPISSIPSNGEQIIRLRLNTAVDEDQEKHYRVYVTQLPDMESSRGASTQIQIKFGVPVFVSPRRPAVVDFELSASPVLDTNELKVTLKNAGKKHLRVNSLQLYALEQLGEDRPTQAPVVSNTVSTSGTIYALPGTTLEWLVQGVPADVESALRLATNFSNFDPALPISRRGDWWLKVGRESTSSRVNSR